VLFLCNIAEKVLDIRWNLRYTEGVGCEDIKDFKL